MKKALIAVLSVIMGVLFMLGMVACDGGKDNGADDAGKVKDAIDTVRNLYIDKSEETAASYKVLGRVKVGDDFYTVKWTVSSETANYQQYVSVGEMDPNDDNQCLVTVTPGDVKVEYTLKATVTVGEASDSVEFKHSIPAQNSVLTVAKAIELASKLENNAYYKENNVITPVFVKGYVVDAGEWNDEKNNLNKVYIADEPDGTTKFYVYRILKDEEYNTQKGAIEKGDLVTLRGALQNYKGNTPELTYCNDVEPAINVTVVSLTKPVKTDADKVAEAKEAVDIPRLFNQVTEITLPATQGEATLSWAKGTTDLVTIADGKLKIVKIPEQETEIKLTVTITSGSVTDTKEIAIYVTPTSVKDQELSVVQVKGLEKTVVSGKYYAENGVITPVIVKGYVVDAGKWESSFNNLNKVYIADTYSEDMTKDSEGTLYVYRIVPDGTYIKGDGDLQKGDLVTFKGYLQNYEGTCQISYQGKNDVVCTGLEKPGLTDAQKIESVLTGITLPTKLTKNAELDLPASAIEGVTLTFASNNEAVIKIENGKMKVTRGQTDVTVKITATAAITGSVSDSEEFNILVKAPVDTTGGKTGSVAIGDYATAKSWTNSTLYDTVEVDENVTVTVNATPIGDYGQNSGKYYTSGTNWRMYQNESPKIVFTASEECKILTVKITYTIDDKKPGVLTNADKTEQYASDEVITVDAETVTFTVGGTGSVTNGQVRITAIEVVYSAPQGADVHEHVWGNYTHVENTWTHKATCTVEGCNETTTPACVPNNNVCSACNHEYTETEILTALFALGKDESLSGTYKLSGKITLITDISTGQYNNTTFTIKVGDKDVTVFRATGTDYDTIKLDDTVTVTGALQNYKGACQLTKCKITKIVVGTHEHNLKYTQKDAARHTVTCENCRNYTELHVYDNDQDTTCNKCEYVRDLNQMLLYTLDTTTKTGENNSYAGNGDVTVGDITWNGEGNLTTSPWRFGGKNITDTDRKLTSKTALAGKVTKIDITFGSSDTITVNSVTLEIYKVDPTSEGATAVSTKTVTYTKGGTVTIEAGEGEDWTNCYYRIIFNVTNTDTSSNKYVTVTKIDFYGKKAD